MHAPPPAPPPGYEFLLPMNFRSWSTVSWMKIKPSSGHNPSNTALSLTASQGSFFSRKKHHTSSKRIKVNNKALSWWLSLVVNLTGSRINSEASCWAHLQGIFLITLIRKCTLNMGSISLLVGRKNFWDLFAYLSILLESPPTLLTSSPSALWLTLPSSTVIALLTASHQHSDDIGTQRLWSWLSINGFLGIPQAHWGQRGIGPDWLGSYQFSVPLG